MSKKKKPPLKVEANEPSKKSSKNSKQSVKLTKRSIDVKDEHIKAAITQYLWSLRLIDETEVVTTWTPSDSKDCTQIHLRKEVLVSK